MKIWIDTDVGGDIDDALALLLSMAEEDVQVLGVSTVFENTFDRAKIAKKLFELGGKPNVKVYAGIGNPRIAKTVHNHVVDCVTPPKTYLEEIFGDVNIDGVDAVGAMKEAFDNNEGVTLVTLGALTNVAKLIEDHPESAKKIKGICIMGGAYGLNLNEFNFTCDPEAADIVLSSAIPKKVISLDVTFKCKVSGGLKKKFCACKSQLLKTVINMNGLWGGEMILHDPLALSTAIKDGLVEFEKSDLKVELSGEFSRGKCVDLTDFNWNRAGREDLLVSKQVKNKEFVKYYVKTVCKLDKKLLQSAK